MEKHSHYIDFQSLIDGRNLAERNSIKLSQIFGQRALENRFVKSILCRLFCCCAEAAEMRSSEVCLHSAVKHRDIGKGFIGLGIDVLPFLPLIAPVFFC